MFRLVLLRHGQTDWNAGDRYQGRSDIELNETGLEQARQAAERWADTEFTAVINSPLKRAQRTAEIVTADRGLSLEPDERLMETMGGLWESLTFPEIIDQWPERYAAWRSPDINIGPVEGETPRESGMRSSGSMLDKIGALRAQGITNANLLVVAHGNTIRAATHLLQGLSDERYADTPRLENCRAHVLISHDGGEHGSWQAEHFNV